MPTTLLSGLRGYPRGWLRADLIASCTVAAYLVPQAMAYAQVAGLPAVAGLWAVLGPLAVYAVMGSSRLLSVGPESPSCISKFTGTDGEPAGQVECDPSDPAARSTVARGPNEYRGGDAG
jgi:MFS superfamily sulfate permease-like transporter